MANVNKTQNAKNTAANGNQSAQNAAAPVNGLAAALQVAANSVPANAPANPMQAHPPVNGQAANGQTAPAAPVKGQRGQQANIANAEPLFAPILQAMQQAGLNLQANVIGVYVKKGELLLGQGTLANAQTLIRVAFAPKTQLYSVHIKNRSTTGQCTFTTANKYTVGSAAAVVQNALFWAFFNMAMPAAVNAPAANAA